MPINARDKHLQKFIEGILEEGKSDTSRYYYDDPTTVGFNLWFHFDGRESPLFNESDDGESAIKYLEAIDEPERADALRHFKQTLKDLTRIYPYYFTELNGLGNPYTFAPDVSFEVDRVLEIKTMESIDSRMGRMIEQYIYAFMDEFNQRQMIPGNLLEFRVSIVISEIRNFRSFVNGTMKTQDSNTKGGTSVVEGLITEFDNKATKSGGGAILQNTTGVNASPTSASDIADRERKSALNGSVFPYTMKDINNNLTSYIYDFGYCRFDFSTSHPYLDSLTNQSPEMVTDVFKIKTGRMRLSHKLDFLDLFAEVEKNGAIPTKQGRSESRTEKALKKMSNKVIGTTVDLFRAESDAFLQNNDPRLIASRYVQDKLVNKFDSKFKSFLFGNVFNFGIGADARNSVLSEILDNRKNPKADIAPIEQSTNKDNLGIKNLQDGHIVKDNDTLGNKDVGGQSTNPNGLDTKDLGGQSTNPDNLTTKDLGGQSTNPKDLGDVTIDKQSTNPDNLTTKDLGGQSTNPNNLSTKDLSIQSTNPKDLSIKDLGGQSTNPNNLATKDLGKQSTNPNNLATKDLGKQSTDSGDLGGVDAGKQSTNPNNLDTKDFGVQSSNPKDLGGVDAGKQSTNPKDLSTKDLSISSINPKDLASVPTGTMSSNVNNLDTVPLSDKSNNPNDLGIVIKNDEVIKNVDLGKKNIADLSAGMVQQFDKINLGTKNVNDINDLGKLDIFNTPLGELKAKGIDVVEGMDIQTLSDMGVVKLNQLDMKAIQDLGVAEKTAPSTLQLMKDNVVGFENAPISSVLETMIKTHLGNIINKEDNRVNKKSHLGNVFDKDKKENPDTYVLKNTIIKPTNIDTDIIEENC